MQLKNIRKLVDEKWPAIKWLVVGPLLNSRWNLMRIVILQGISTVFQVAGFLVIIKFVTLLLNDWNITLLKNSLNFSEHKNMVFWSILLSTLTLLLCGALFSYIARRKVANLARVSEENILIQVTKAYVRNFAKNSNHQNDQFDINTFKTFYSRGGRFVGRAIMSVASSLIPLILSIISLSILFFLKPFLTFFLLLIIVLAFPFYIKVAKRGQEASLSLLKYARQAQLQPARQHPACLPWQRQRDS